MKGSHGKILKTPAARNPDHAENAGAVANARPKRSLATGCRLLRQRIAAGLEAYHRQVVSLRVYPRERFDWAQAGQHEESLRAPE